MGKKKGKKIKPNYNAQNRPVGGNSLGCTQQPPPKKPGVTCQFSKIELTVAKTPKAGDTKVLSIPASATNGNSRSIEVISGDKSKKSDADLKIVGAQKCRTRPMHVAPRRAQGGSGKLGFRFR